MADLALERPNASTSASRQGGALWRLGLKRAKPRIEITQTVEAATYDLTGIIREEGLGDLGAHHFLRATAYEARRFVVGVGADIGMLSHSKAVFAPERGFIAEFNIGGVAHLPEGLIDADLTRAGPSWRLARRAKVERVEGLSVPFCHYGQGAFGHFVLDGLLQVYLFEHLLKDGSAKLAHWPFEKPWMSDLLTRVGVGPSARRILRRPIVVFEGAALSSALAAHGVYFPNALSPPFFGWLRGKLAPEIPASGATGKVYVRRGEGEARAVLNQAELEAHLVAQGFQIIDPRVLDAAAQATLIAQSHTLVSPWGSGQTLAPLLGGARRVIELTPDTVTDAWFSRQAGVHRLDYTPLLHPASASGDIVVNIADLDKVLTRS